MDETDYSLPTFGQETGQGVRGVCKTLEGSLTVSSILTLPTEHELKRSLARFEELL